MEITDILITLGRELMFVGAAIVIAGKIILVVQWWRSRHYRKEWSDWTEKFEAHRRGEIKDFPPPPGCDSEFYIKQRRQEWNEFIERRKKQYDPLNKNTEYDQLN